MELTRKLSGSRTSRVVWGLAPLALGAVLALTFVFAWSSLANEQRAAQARAVDFTTRRPLSSLTVNQASHVIQGELSKQLLRDLQGKVLSDDRVTRVRIWNLSGTLVFSTDPGDRAGVAELGSPPFKTASSGGVASIVTTGPTPAGGNLAATREQEYITFAGIRLENQARAGAVVEVEQRYAAIQAAASKLWRPIQTVLAGLIALCVVVLLVSVVASRMGLRTPRGDAAAAAGPGFSAAGSSRAQRELENRLRAMEDALRSSDGKVAAAEREKRQIAERLVTAHEQLELMTAAAKGARPSKEDGSDGRRLRELENERDRMAAEVERLRVALDERPTSVDGGSGSADPNAEARIAELEAALDDARAKAASLESVARQFEEERKEAAAELERARSAATDNESEVRRLREQAAADKARVVTRSKDQGSLAEAAAELARAEERAKQAEELVMQAEARAKRAGEDLVAEQERNKKADERVGYAEERLKLAEERAHAAGDQVRQAEERGKEAQQEAEERAREAQERAKEQARDAEEMARQVQAVAEEQARQAEERGRQVQTQAEERARAADERAGYAEEQARLAKDESRQAEDKAIRADEETRAALDRAAQAEARLTQAEARTEQAQASAMEMERRAVQAEQRIATLETVTKQAEERMTQLEEGARQNQQRASQAEARAKELEDERARLASEVDRSTSALKTKDEEIASKEIEKGRAEQAEGRLRALEEDRALIAAELERVRAEAPAGAAAAAAAPPPAAGDADERLAALAAQVEQLEAQRRDDVSEVQRLQQSLANTQLELTAALKRAKEAEDLALKGGGGAAPQPAPPPPVPDAPSEAAPFSRPERRSRRPEDAFASEPSGETIAARLSRARARKEAPGEARAAEAAEAPAEPATDDEPAPVAVTPEGLSLRERLARAAAARHRVSPGEPSEESRR